MKSKSSAFSLTKQLCPHEPKPKTIMQKNRISQSGTFLLRVLIAFALCSVGVFLAPMPAAAELNSRPDHTGTTDGPVYAIVRSVDTIYIGGRFSLIGPRSGPGVALNADGSKIIGQPELSGSDPAQSSQPRTHAVIADG